MRRLKNFALAASACVLAGGALTACSPPGEQPSDQPGGDPTRGAIASDGANGTGGAGGNGANGAGGGADDISGLTQSGGRYNLIANHLVEGTVELRHDGNGTAAVVAEEFNTGLNDGTYELRGYVVASCEAISGATDDLAVLGELKVAGGTASVTPRTGDVDPVQVLTIAAVKPGGAGAGEGTASESGGVVACGPWIKWVGENQPIDQPTESETNGG